MSELQTGSLNTEMQALESRIERYNQELAIVDKQQDIARLRQQSDKQHQLIIEAKLDALQPLINERRLNQLEETANSRKPISHKACWTTPRSRKPWTRTGPCVNNWPEPAKV